LITNFGSDGQFHFHSSQPQSVTINFTKSKPADVSMVSESKLTHIMVLGMLKLGNKNTTSRAQNKQQFPQKTNIIK